LKILDAYLSFVLSSVFLRTSKSLNIGQFDQLIYAWVILVFESSFVKINLHYFAIYAHVSPIMLGFALFVFVITDLHISSQVLREKYED